MHKEDLIPAHEFCSGHNIEISFISSLKETGLIEVTTVTETEFIPASQLRQLEKIVRLYHELDINLEGIEAIIHLLNRVTDMQDQITALNNRLRRYESGDL